MTTKHTSSTSHALRNKFALIGMLTAASQLAPLQPSALAENNPAVTSKATFEAPVSDKAGQPSGDQTRTKNGYLACTQKQWLQDFANYSVAGDHESANAYIASNKCVPLRGGLVVTLSDTSSPRGTVSFFYRGVELWTVADAIER